MTKEEWMCYLGKISQQGILDSEVQISYHWNSGTTRSKRKRTIRGTLYFANESGVELHTGKRLSYKVIQCICHIGDSKTKLRDLCQAYVWFVISGYDSPRFKLHRQIADILQCEPDVGYLKWALHNLEKSVQLPDYAHESQWKKLANKCGKRLADNLLRIYTNNMEDDTNA